MMMKGPVCRGLAWLRESCLESSQTSQEGTESAAFVAAGPPLSFA